VAINSRGWILGTNSLWTSLTAFPMPLAGAAMDINDRGQVVGIMGDYPNRETVVWTIKP
jgi:hypothetical protein